jgi:hypothetical protein
MKKTPQELREYNRQWFKTPRGRYHHQKSTSLSRGVEFLLTFEEWWDIWQTSGKWELRGRRRGQYVMARFGDRGPYERSNIRICLVEENIGESNQNCDNPTEQRSAVMKAWWASASKKKRAAISHALSVNNGSHRPEVRAKQSAAAKIVWARRRGEIA